MNGEAAALAGLLASSFLSATILPGNSEVVLAAVVSKLPGLFWTAVAVATLGNTVGGMTSYALGRLIPAQGGRKLAPQAVALAQRCGIPMLLLAWVPVIGDALCVAPGRRVGLIRRFGRRSGRASAESRGRGLSPCAR